MINICNISFSCYVTCYCYSIFCLFVFFNFENSISTFLKKIYIAFTRRRQQLNAQKKGSLEIKKQTFHFCLSFYEKKILKLH